MTRIDQNGLNRLKWTKVDQTKEKKKNCHRQVYYHVIDLETREIDWG